MGGRFFSRLCHFAQIYECSLSAALVRARPAAGCDDLALAARLGSSMASDLPRRGAMAPDLGPVRRDREIMRNLPFAVLPISKAQPRPRTRSPPRPSQVEAASREAGRRAGTLAALDRLDREIPPADTRQRKGAALDAAAALQAMAKADAKAQAEAKAKAAAEKRAQAERASQMGLEVGHLDLLEALWAELAGQ